MCRLFGFRSLFPSDVHRSLVRETNALQVQSREHPDGWGIGWWSDAAPTPHLVRSAGAAYAEEEFKRTALVSSSAVIAHLRKASVGPVTLDNAHPFRWGPWLFAHNGTVSEFDACRAKIEREIDPVFLPVVIGDTDSARCFGVFLTRLARLADPAGDVPLKIVARALAETVHIVCGIADPGAATPSATTFLVGNGKLMLAFRRGRTLWYSAHKNRCADRDACAHFGAGCEAPVATDEPVNHLIIASERVSLEDVWSEVPLEGMIGVDHQMRLHRFAIGELLAKNPKTSAA